MTLKSQQGRRSNSLFAQRADVLSGQEESSQSLAEPVVHTENKNCYAKLKNNAVENVCASLEQTSKVQNAHSGVQRKTSGFLTQSQQARESKARADMRTSSVQIHPC